MVQVLKSFHSLHKKIPAYRHYAYMNRKTLILFFCLLITKASLLAQSDNYPGTWQMEYFPKGGNPSIHLELQIAAAEEAILYPAKLSLQCDSFTAVYELLLVKKNSREIGISKNKYPRIEKPFSLGSATIFLNGIFDYSRDLKGIPTLTISRLQSKPMPVPAADTFQLNKVNKLTAINLINFLKEAEIKLTKINTTQWNDAYSERIVSPAISPAYFGLLDTIYLKTQDGNLHLSDNKKNDVVSITLNGRMVVDRIVLNKKPHAEDILLDTGLNLLVFFADNFANELPNKGKLNLEFGNKKFTLDFANRGDSAASFIVAKLYCEHDKEKDISFKEYNPYGRGEKKLQDNERLMGGIVSNSQQLTLAIWDDAVEDGDSVSINLNGNWVAKGFPVKIRPQFITVKLKPGTNTLTFSADNLGSIPPNTSIIEIIDGKKRKSFSLETILGENNLIKVLYDVKPD